MTEERNVWVFIEQEDGRIADVSLELLGKAHELARHLGGKVWGLLFGSKVADLTDQALQHGADHLLVADHPELEVYRTLPYTRVAEHLVKSHEPYIFLIGATPVGRDLAPRIASAVEAGLTADCTDLQIGDY
jgi:electron transfer flavoprotein alpha subunit